MPDRFLWQIIKSVFLAMALSLIPSIAYAHDGSNVPFNGFPAGLVHPVLEHDHFLAILSVGILFAISLISYYGVKMNRKLVQREIGSIFFIGLIGAALHFTYEFSNFSRNMVAYFSAVNESTWEHLKMVFFPSLIFALIEYTYVRETVRNYLIAKTVALFLMPLVITVGWYIYAPAVGRRIYPVDLALLYIAVFVGQLPVTKS